MTGWRLAWRATIAWMISAIGASLAFALALTALNLWVDPNDASEIGQTIALIWAVVVVGLLVGGGVLLAIAVLIARTWGKMRPLVECLVLAAACFGITNSGGLVQFSLTTATGVVAPMAHPAAFICAYIAPALAGALMGWLYWKIAAPKPSGAAA